VHKILDQILSMITENRSMESGMLLEVGMVHCCNVGSAVEGVEQGQSLVAAGGMSQDIAITQIRDRWQDC